MTTTVVYPFDARAPSGLHALARQVVDALLANAQRVRLVLAKPSGLGGPFDLAARESYDGRQSQLEVCWLPADTFEPDARHRLSFALERMADDTARWLCFGIASSAFVGGIVARQSGTPCASVVVARDLLGRALQHPDEIGAVLARSQQIFCTAPESIELLDAFHPAEITERIEVGSLAMIRPACATPTSAPAAVAEHVCTTGVLGVFEDLGELVERVVAEMRATGATRWLHLGIVHPRSIGRLASALSLRGLTAAFDATGVCGVAEYERHVRSARVFLKARGEIDTGVSIVEARRWGVRVSLPAELAAASDAAGWMLPRSGVAVVDPAALAAGLCA